MSFQAANHQVGATLLCSVSRSAHHGLHPAAERQNRGRIPHRRWRELGYLPRHSEQRWVTGASRCPCRRLSSSLDRHKSGSSLGLPANLNTDDANMERVPRLQGQALDGRPGEQELPGDLQVGWDKKREVVRGLARRHTPSSIDEGFCLVRGSTWRTARGLPRSPKAPTVAPRSGDTDNPPPKHDLRLRPHPHCN